MDKWRSKDWDAESIVIGVYQELTTETTEEKERKLVEAGADAMLKALREEHPCYINEDDIANIGFPLLGNVRGFFVFIPDEKESNHD